MKQLCLFLTAAAAILAPASAQQHEPFLGRWDVTVTTSNATYPDWLNVVQTGGRLTGTIQPRSGGAFAVDDLKKDGPNHLVIKAKQATWDLTMNGDKFTGTIKQGDAVQAKLEGVRAPALKRPMPKAWTDPEPILNGKDLSGWEPMTPDNNHWVVKNGELVNEVKGANLKTTRKFDDFKLHIEYNCPNDGNSGIYLRGRYEVQVEYQDVDASDPLHSIGAIYSFLAPQAQIPRKPGTWESFDITLVGRFVSIVRNGIKTMDNLEIPGPTGGALDSHEAEPGPFYIQGDHTGGMKYRNITISVPKN